MKMKRNIFLVSFLTVLSAMVFAQTAKVNWVTSSKKIANGKYEIHFTAKVPSGYHLYSQFTGEGPVATSFQFDKNALISLEGKVKEKGKLISIDDAVWNNKQKFYSGTVDFVQIVKQKTKAKTNISGGIEYMICDDKKCLPPTTQKFNVVLN
jgi:thiol:disulfide interchange protein DsbD